MLLSGLAGDALGYGVSARDLVRRLRRPPPEGVRVAYPGYGPLRLFTQSELRAMLGAAGLTVTRTWGIHGLTNLIPSTVLHRPRLSRPAAALFRALAAADERRRRRSGGAALANSVVVLARRAPAGTSRAALDAGGTGGDGDESAAARAALARPRPAAPAGPGPPRGLALDAGGPVPP
jgi:hypothetical protein